MIMPKDPIDLMKGISIFDMEKHYADSDSRKDLAMMFHNLIMSEDPKAKEYLDRFLKGSSKIVADMGIIDESEVDDVEMPEEEPVDEVPVDEPVDDTGSEELPADTGGEEDAVDEVPDDLLAASVRPRSNPMVERANSFLYM